MFREKIVCRARRCSMYHAIVVQILVLRRSLHSAGRFERSIPLSFCASISVYCCGSSDYACTYCSTLFLRAIRRMHWARSPSGGYPTGRSEPAGRSRYSNSTSSPFSRYTSGHGSLINITLSGQTLYSRAVPDHNFSVDQTDHTKRFEIST